jgi:20S proteasome subunit beta 7
MCRTTEYCIDDGGKLYPKEVWNYLTRVMYNRRNKFNPLWNQLIVAGFRDNKSFLGTVNYHGTSFEDNTIATGYGNYMAQPLLRKAYAQLLCFSLAASCLSTVRGAGGRRI